MRTLPEALQSQSPGDLHGPRDFRLWRRLLLFTLVTSFSACGLFEPEPATFRFKTMGTQASLTLRGRDTARLPAAGRRVEEVMARLDKELSVYKPDSVISRLNRLAGVRPLEVPPDTLRLLELSKQYGELSGGAFDVTVGPVLRLWRFGQGRPPALPSEEALRERLALVGYSRIELRGRSAFLRRQGMSVDLGGIAKGYAVDLAWQECRKYGVADFMIDLGGNIRVSGKPARGAPWRIAIRNPFDRSSTLANLEMKDGRAVASSGQYERFVEIEGRRYGHILDPRTGYPASGLASVTVLAMDATTADVLSTSLFVLGPQASVPLLKQTRAEAVFVPDKEPVDLWVTPGLEEQLAVLSQGTVRRLPGW